MCFSMKFSSFNINIFQKLTYGNGSVLHTAFSLHPPISLYFCSILNSSMSSSFSFSLFCLPRLPFEFGFATASLGTLDMQMPGRLLFCVYFSFHSLLQDGGAPFLFYTALLFLCTGDAVQATKVCFSVHFSIYL